MKFCKCVQTYVLQICMYVMCKWEKMGEKLCTTPKNPQKVVCGHWASQTLVNVSSHHCVSTRESDYRIYYT